MKCMSLTLRDKLLDPQQFIALYGTTPPRADATPARVARAADKLIARINPLPLDGVVVYDVQDESGRTTEPRPFPFLPTLDSRTYAKLLHERSSQPVIAYKSITGMAEEQWQPWLNATAGEYGINYLSLVGISSSRNNQARMSLTQATQVAAAHPGGFTLGGVVIAERHSAEQRETDRLLHKAQNGCRFFISQAIYDADTTIRLLHDYAQTCARAGIPPKRIILTFIPCGRPKTLDFIKWLGIAIAPQTVQTILDAPQPLSKSIEICAANLQAILAQEYVQTLPLGVNVESVSINKDEIDASIDLFHVLQNVMQSHRPQRV